MEKIIDLDAVLRQLGEFGKFQKRNYALICLVVIFSVVPMGYIFTTRNSKYRCLIEECENENSNYNNKWLRFAIPFKNNVALPCLRFAGSGKSNGTCTKQSFDNTRNETCNKYIFKHPHSTIQHDFNIVCDENLWKLTIVGTLNNVGELMCLPLSGLVSDRYGRRTMMIASVLLSTIIGFLKSLAYNYASYLSLEFLDTFVSSGTYSAAYILAIELVVPKQRVLGSTLLACAFAIGEAILGLAAWVAPTWRVMLRILYLPGVFFVFYYWYANESVRWLISKGRYDEAKRILKKVAKTNGTVFDENTLEHLGQLTEEQVVPKKETLKDVFKSRVMFLRVNVCAFTWICCTFVYYGITMHSISISGNLYINFIIVALIEIPAYFVSYKTLDIVGRKLSQAISLILSGVSCIMFVFIPEENWIIRLLLFLVGKFSVTIAYTTLYIYTTEIFPTNLRHSLLSMCSMFGRFGAMIAPQVPLLAKIHKSLPLMMFGAMATSSGLLSLLFPETLKTKLPDTIEEAVSIGKKPQSV